tara:strand:+ start:229 stop:603 length:375 start_codon:yes stop_codon:yes gene_type:complete
MITDISDNPFGNGYSDKIEKEEDYLVDKEVKIDSWIKSFVNAEIFQDDKKLELTQSFKNLSKLEQHKLVSQTFHNWYDRIANKKVNELYNDKLLDNTLKGDILDSWNQYIRKNFSLLYDTIFHP